MIASNPAINPTEQCSVTRESWFCPLCDGSSTRLFECHGFWIRECWDCGHRFAEYTPGEDHLADVYGNDYFTGGGAGYDNYLAERTLLQAHGRRYAALMSQYLQPGRVFDVGAAAGFLLQGFVNAGWEGFGVEPNAAMARFARSQLGLPVLTGELEAFASPKRFDLVTMIQVVAHFTDVRRAFRAAADITQTGGYWLIETWNPDSWTAQFFGKHWHEYSPPSVLHWFTPEALAEFALRFGMQQVAVGRPEKRLNAGHAASLLRYKLRGLPFGRVATWPLQFVPQDFAIRYPGDDVFWALFRKHA